MPLPRISVESWQICHERVFFSRCVESHQNLHQYRGANVFWEYATDAALGPRLASSVRDKFNRDSLNRIFKKIFIRLSSCLDVPEGRM